MKIIKDKKIVMIILSIILVIIVMSSTTYALFFKTHTFDNTESYTAGILDITVEEGSKLSLTNTLPMTDEEGAKTTPYTFTITNNGNISYTFDLKMLSTTTSNQINSKYIKVKLDDNEPVLLSSISSGIIANDLKLDPGKSVTMSVRIWLDISTPNTEIGKKFSAKIVTDGVGSEYVPTGADTITSIFTSADKTTVTNNSVEYEYATSVGMMEDIGGNIRYYGADPNNYVKFNNELWRIIGVFKDIDDGTGKKETRVKIARSESIGNYAWDSNNKNEWPTATLNTYLNGTYLNSLSSEAQAMVGNAKWNLGGWNTSRIYANQFYEYERGTTVYSGKSTEWTGKIALMYPSDYMYAGDLSKCSKDGYNWDADQTNCRDTSWLRNTSVEQWTITPLSYGSYDVFLVINSGFVSYNFSVSFSYASRPVLFLTSTVQITGGEGTQSNPYILG